jgi:hypothetical protein
MENSEARKRKEEINCNHYYGLAYDLPDGWELRHYLAKSPSEEHMSDLFTYCPKCGEKL